MFSKFISLKAALLALILGLTITFFLGCFAHAPYSMDESFSGNYWYYINRGYPTAWAGVSLTKARIEFPHIKMPFLSYNAASGSKLIKIIDIYKFISILLVTVFASYIPSFILARAVDENKRLLPFFIILNIVFIGTGLFLYFSWFSRV